MNIGNGIRSLRKKHNLTMEQLANNLNKTFPNSSKFTKSKLSKWENGKEEPRLSSAKLISDYFNVTIDELYNNTAHYHSLRNSSEERIYAHIKNDVTAEELEEIKNFIEYVKSKRENKSDK